MTLREHLAQISAQWRSIKAPAGAWLVEEFLARKGLSCLPQPLPNKYPQMQAKACFFNAARLVRNRIGLRYCEGMIWRDTFPIPFLHAWAIDWENRVVDPTLERPEECEYVGYALPLAKRKQWLARGSASVFDTGHGVNFEFILHEEPALLALIDKDQRELVESRMRQRIKI